MTCHVTWQDNPLRVTIIHIYRIEFVKIIAKNPVDIPLESNRGSG